MITTSRTMPESDFTPEGLSSERNRDRPAAHPEPQPNLADTLLNSSELQTVLDMLAVMEAAEELDQLQALTEAQKRQVWEATSESLKQKLWQIRNQPNRDRSAVAPNRRLAETLEDKAQEGIQDEYLEEGDLTEDHDELESERRADLEDEIEDLGQDLALAADSYLSPTTKLTGASLSGVIQSGVTASPSQTESLPIGSAAIVPPQVGDRVILKAQLRLSSAELKAVWQLQQIDGNNGEVYDPKLGVRIYPLSWMAVYAKAEAANLEESPDPPYEGEEDF